MTSYHIIGFGVLTLSLLGCGTTTTFDARRTLPEEVQRDVYAQCAAEMHFSHMLALHKLKSRDGLLYVRGSDGSGVLVAEANNLNRCAWAKMDAIVSAQSG